MFGIFFSLDKVSKRVFNFLKEQRFFGCCAYRVVSEIQGAFSQCVFAQTKNHKSFLIQHNLTWLKFDLKSLQSSNANRGLKQIFMASSCIYFAQNVNST